ADLRPLEGREGVEAGGAGDQAEDHQHHHDRDQRHAARGRLAGPSQMFCKHVRVLYWGMKVFSCMIGIRIENTMKATPPPIATIITGSRSEVSAPMRISPCAS